MSVIASVQRPKVSAPTGASFLVDDMPAKRVLTPEDFNEAQRQVIATTDRFMGEEVLPRLAEFERKEEGLARSLIESSAEIGLLGVLVPERYDGLEMDMTTQMLVSERIGSYASFSTTYGAHAGIGTLPIVFFGSEEQKRKYLPRLVSAELLAAYCLSEPQAGSDSLASLTRADRTRDGRHYVLNGQKMWISNGGWADLYTVFGKVSGEKFTAFLVERSWDGVKTGAEEQKRKYLPRLVSAELLAAYCLSEPQAGSDSLASLTRADRTRDGRHYVLNGQKMWISNGGWADLYTVFGKVSGEKFTAFLVERSWDGVKTGAEEHKMGLRGSSTTALYLDNVRVPVENVLGEVGRGHVIAFNVLNMGRLELAAACVGGNKDLIAEATSYASQRKAFGRPIAQFGAIRQKLADMAVRTFAGEALVYRTSGMIDARLEGFSWDAPGAATTALQAVEEYAIECSIAKVYLSEALDFVADEAVQIHGGYGYHEDYAVERGYRDSRINRIFEGTNEINRLLTTGMLLKRAEQGRLDLRTAIAKSAAKGASDSTAGRPRDSLSRHRDLVARSKRSTLSMAGLAYQRFGTELAQQQEVCTALADMVMGVYAAESALLRAEKLKAAGSGKNAEDMLTVLTQLTMGSLRQHGSLILGACCESSELERAYAAFESLARAVPADLPAARDRIAARVLGTGRYTV
jgi:alkylation response protein AidB-like acyl-CoA dehydrogenase